MNARNVNEKSVPSVATPKRDVVDENVGTETARPDAYVGNDLTNDDLLKRTLLLASWLGALKHTTNDVETIGWH